MKEEPLRSLEPVLKPKTKSQLDSVFYSDEFVMGNKVRFTQAVRQKGFDLIPTKLISDYYDNQEVVQVMAPAKKSSASKPIIRLFPFSVVYADTMFIDQFAIITFVDAFSKFGFAVAFKSPTDSKKAFDAWVLFLATIGGMGYKAKDVRELRTDSGTEFKGIFDKTVYGKHTRTLPYAKSESGLIERFNGTIRTILEKLAEVRGKPIEWLHTYLPVAINAYNHMTHSTTKEAPVDVLKSVGSQERAASQLRSKLAKAVSKYGDTDEFEVGNHVRIYLRDKSNPFDKKIGANWTRDLFVVEGVDSKYKRYKVNGLWYKPDLLMKVNIKTLVNRRKDRVNLIDEKVKKETR